MDPGLFYKVIKKAKKKPSEALEIDNLDHDEDDLESKTKTIDVFSLSPEKEAGRTLEGEASEQIQELISILKNDEKVMRLE